MERIMIMGCGGSGKSTLARRLGQLLGLPVVHLDRLWWTGTWENVTREEFDVLLAKEVAKPRWIIDGNFNRTIQMRLDRCDTVIYLDFNRFVCLWGAVKRVLQNYGKTRPDMGGDCPERFDPEFMKWIWDFNKQHRKEYYAMLRQKDDARVVILKNRGQVRRFLRELEA